MKYPTVSVARAVDVALGRLEGEATTLTVEWEGAGDELEIEALDSLSLTVKDLYESFLDIEIGTDLDRFEGTFGLNLLEELERQDVPTVVLDDPGFWRYLAVGPFWWYAERREPGAFGTKDPGRFSRYIDGKRSTECIPLRAYLRARIMTLAGEPDLASSIERGTDFWRSHVMRVRTGSAPLLAAAFAREQRDDRMDTDELRPYAKRLNRVWTNVVLHVYEQSEAKDLIRELRA